MRITKKEYEKYLNVIGEEMGIPEHDKKSNGGRVPDNCKFGNWIRRNDPILFNVGFNEFSYNDRKED